MVHGEVVAAGGSGDDLSVTVRAYSDSGDPGIRLMVLRNARSVPVWSATVAGCPAMASEFVEHLSNCCPDQAVVTPIADCAA